MESDANKLVRAQKFREILNEIVIQQGEDAEQKVLIVSHSMFCTDFARPLNKRHINGILGPYIDNCTMIPITQEFLAL